MTKPGHYRDGNGLYLQVSKWGTKSWVFKFTVPTYETGADAMKSILAEGAPKRVRDADRAVIGLPLYAMPPGVALKLRPLLPVR